MTPKEKALKLLEKKDKTEYELKVSLKKAGFDDIDIEDAIADLKEAGYVDDYSFTCRFIEMSMENLRGPLRMKRDLKAKGITDEEMNDALETIMDDDYEWDAAQKIVESIQKKNAGASTEKLLVKITNKLNYEGFSDTIINDVAEDIYNDL